MKRKVVLAWMTMLMLAITACSSSPTVSTVDGTWIAPQPPDEWASGLSIGYISPGFTFIWNIGHETATFHVFMTADESEQVSIGRQISPQPYPTPGQAVTRGDREFTIVEETTQIRVLEEVGSGIRIEVVSASLDPETLLRIAENTSYDPTNDR